MNLTFPEIVTTKNKEYLQKLFKMVEEKYPGANYVKKETKI